MDGQGGQGEEADTTKAIVAFRNISNASLNS